MLWILYVKVDWGIRPRALTVCVCVSAGRCTCVYVCVPKRLMPFESAGSPSIRARLPPKFPVIRGAKVVGIYPRTRASPFIIPAVRSLALYFCVSECMRVRRVMCCGARSGNIRARKGADGWLSLVSSWAIPRQQCRDSCSSILRTTG